MLMIAFISKLFQTVVTRTDVAPTAILLWNKAISHQFWHIGDVGDMGCKCDIIIINDILEMGDVGYMGEFSDMGYVGYIGSR